MHSFSRRAAAQGSGLPWHPGRAPVPLDVRRRLKSYLIKAGLPVDITPHQLRHSFATHLFKGGANSRIIQDSLGHASLATTQIYTKVAGEHAQGEYRKAHPRNKM
ncbi:MAG TPA: tyrosine-type recombinase/integrase [bacterium]|nr:tyrosine-type recombinase/integrase [bacterium]